MKIQYVCMSLWKIDGASFVDGMKQIHDFFTEEIEKFRKTIPADQVSAMFDTNDEYGIGVYLSRPLTEEEQAEEDTILANRDQLQREKDLKTFLELRTKYSW